MTSPDYSIKMYREDYYKVVRFDTQCSPAIPVKRGSEAVHEGKLSQSLSRARSVIKQVAICNDWDWFFTCTLSPDKHDRYSLSAFQVDFPQWIRDYRKKYGCDLKYLVVPERHQDGAWHIHGFLSGVPSGHIGKFISGIHPVSLVEGAYYNWPLCSSKFGYCSLAPIRDPIAAGHYVTKYITEDMGDTALGLGCHLYYCSIGLRRALSCGYVYGRRMLLDLMVTQEHQFCSTGFTDALDWVLVCELVDTYSVFNHYAGLPDPEFLAMSNVQISFDDLISRGGCSW